MRSLAFLGCAALLVSAVSCREIRGERPRSYKQIKGKRGVGDYPMGYSSGGFSYNVPGHSNLHSGYSAGGGSSGGYSLDHGSLQGLQSFGGGAGGHGLAYSGGLGLGSAYKFNFGSGLGHGLSLQGLSLGGHDGTSSLSNYGGGVSLFSQPSKTGPVTFGIHGGGSSNAGSSSSPSYAAGTQGLSAYGSSQSGSISLPVSLGSTHGSAYSLQALPLGSSSGGSGGYIPVSSGASSGLHASGSQASHATYNLPVSSGSSHGLSLSGLSSGSHGGSSGYALPLFSGLAGLSSHAGASGYGQQAASNSYNSPIFHVGQQSGSSEASSYMVPITSGSYAVQASPASASYSNYSPAGSDAESSSYSSAGSSSYSSPSSSYSAPSTSYSAAASGYSSPSSSQSSPTVTYSAPSSSYSSSSGGYSSSYSSPVSSHGSSSESQGSYSNLSPRYVGYSAAKAYENIDSGSTKYDTISYSSPNGKY